MINELKLKVKNIDDLENFIRENDNELYEFIGNKKRSELIELKKDFKEIILFNKKTLKKLNTSIDKNINFIVFLANISNNLFLNMEFKILFKLLESPSYEIKIVNDYITIDNIELLYLFNKKLSNSLRELDSKCIDIGFKKTINTILTNYYIHLITSFNSNKILIDFSGSLFNINDDLKLMDYNLFSKIFNLKRTSDNRKNELNILNILDDHTFSIENKNNLFKIPKPPEKTYKPPKKELNNALVPTEEQKSIIEQSKKMKKGQVLIIEALAGCTKTSSLEMVTKSNPQYNFLYLAFNTKIVEDAKKRFPKNTTVKTLHSLGFQYESKNKLILNNINNIISEIFNLDISINYNDIYNIYNIYNKFCNSESSINEIPLLKTRLIKEIKENFSKTGYDKSKEAFLINKINNAIPHIKKLYEYMSSSKYTTHSTYLKQFVENMDDHVLKYDFIILDESQDVSRLLGKFIIKSILSYNYKVIVVGDNNQKIYGFIDNINLSKSIKNVVDNTIYIERSLTKTFRFSKDTNIEYLTNLILINRNHKIIGAKPKKVLLKKQNELNKSFLSRGSLSVLFKALELLKEKTSYQVFITYKDFDSKLIIDLYELYRYTMKIKRKLIVNKNIDLNELESFSPKDSNDQNFKYIKNIFISNKDNDLFPKLSSKHLKNISSIYELEYNSYKNDISNNLEALKVAYFIIYNFDYFNYFKIEENYKHIIDKSLFILLEKFSNKHSLNKISTIHKVKGLEYEEVTIISSETLFRKIITTNDDDEIRCSSPKSRIIGLEEIEIKIKNTSLNKINFEDSYNNRIELSELEEIPQKIKTELIINKEIDTQEEYNILYVAITRAEHNIFIENETYLETLKFLEFIKNNSKEIENIINDKKSNKSNKEGIIYLEHFISIKTLKLYMLEFKQYNGIEKNKQITTIKDKIISDIKDGKINLENISYSSIKQKSCKFRTQDVWEQLGRGRNILETQDQLNQYWHSYSTMIKNQWDFVLNSVDFSRDRNIEIIDYGCGQGLASILILDKHLNKIENYSKIILVEPSKIALDRAKHIMHCYLSKEKVETVNKKLDNILYDDIKTSKNAIKIHLFSNILDIDDFSTIDLFNKIIKNKGVHHILAVSHDRDFNGGAVRLKDFYNIFIDEKNHTLFTIKKYKIEKFNAGDNQAIYFYISLEV